MPDRTRIHLMLLMLCYICTVVKPQVFVVDGLVRSTQNMNITTDPLDTPTAKA